MDRVPFNSTIVNENCEECSCQKGDISHCKPKVCPPCGDGLHTELTLDCNCMCKTCPPDTKVCPTSQTCLLNKFWCDGIEHCPDDEENCEKAKGLNLF